jgi:hypothetical protein
MTDTQLAYVVWSNEHSCWWGPNHCGYTSKLSAAGRYTRDEALKICRNARGGREFNDNPSEVPLLFDDAAVFWGEDRDEWAEKRRSQREKRRQDFMREYGYWDLEETDD